MVRRKFDSDSAFHSRIAFGSIFFYSFQELFDRGDGCGNSVRLATTMVHYYCKTKGGIEGVTPVFDSSSGEEDGFVDMVPRMYESSCD